MVMAALGIHSGGNVLYPSFLSRNKSDQTSSPNQLLSLSSNSKEIRKQCISASITSSNSSLVYPSPGEVMKAESHSKNNTVFSGDIDSLMRQSVEGIVKNLKQAPLLVRIYSENDGSSENGTVKLQTEKAVMEEWPALKMAWKSGKSKSPDALIFVGELEPDEENTSQGFEEGSTKAWGVVVQRRGMECGPACYLLKTDRVCAGLGLGFCTYFCLMRVNNFRDSALEQFRDLFLLN